MKIVKLKSFEKNRKLYSSVPGLIISVEKVLEALKIDDFRNLQPTMLKGKNYPKGTLKVRLGNFRLLYLIIRMKNNETVAVVMFDKRGSVYDKKHANEFNQKVSELDN